VPFLRVLRDRRGYETTYLMDWFREGPRQRSRLLYVFRTPGGVRVGRSPLDPETLQQIESRYPDIAFDWGSVFENQQVIEAGPPVRRRRSKREESDEGVPGPGAVSAESPAQPAPVSSGIPSAIEGTTPDEQRAFLKQWYPIVRDRIAQRITDPARREVLTTVVERLNLEACVEADEISTGIQQAAEALERLSRVLARRRRRSRRRPSSTGPADEASPSTNEVPSPPAVPES
jgi:hypothetical protein